MISERKEGDISAIFASLSGKGFDALDPRFANVKRKLIVGHEDAVVKSWHHLLASLEAEIPTIARQKSSVVPEINFEDLQRAPEDFAVTVRKRGVVVIRNVIPESEALALKQELRDYISKNPQTKAFPPEKPQVFELYWSPAQIKARSNPQLLAAQKWLMQLWHSKDDTALISSDHPTIYADRLRLRLPGDTLFSLGPHIDSGSCERWEPEGYGRGHVYDKIWQGKWEEYDPWESSCRLPVQSDLYEGIGACTAFRMFQGWLSLSNTSPFEGTLLVNPLLQQATAYFLLRPFFKPRIAAADAADTKAYLAPDNWELDVSSDNSWLQGARPGHCQEIVSDLHPHLRLDELMVHVPRVSPGDYVAWHCDTIHAVDKVHKGTEDSTVMYIPACPLTLRNAEFMASQRARFLSGAPSPDFGGGMGESKHVDRPSVADVEAVDAMIGMQAFGLKPWDTASPNMTSGQQLLVEQANRTLGFN